MGTLFPGKSQILNADTKQDAMNFIKSMDSDMGGTNILAPIEGALDLADIPEFNSSTGAFDILKKNVFVITAGDDPNHNNIFYKIKLNNDKMRVFTIGVGAGAN